MNPQPATTAKGPKPSLQESALSIEGHGPSIPGDRFRQPFSKRERNRRIVEMLLLFFLLPGGLLVVHGCLRWMAMPLVLFGGVVFGALLARDGTFDRRAILSCRGFRRDMGRILFVFLLPACLLTAAVYWLDRRDFLAFPAAHFKIWLLVMVLYPGVGALLQEVIFRCFFFHRYERLFHDSRIFLLANATSFAMFHLFYLNPVAPAFAFLGGLLFAHRYLRTRSLVAVAFEHGLWGGFLFTIGLGRFFFSGAIR